MSDEILRVLEEIKQQQKAAAARQEEALAFLRTEAEAARRVRDEALAMQRTATARVRRIGVFAFAGIVMCIVLIVYLVSKYRILF
jgi:t-SNARE complex subunit (syntaxin)